MPNHKRPSLPRVALVGRTNVGKSTLWNRFTSSGRALVSPDPHTTRDRNYGLVFWQGGIFELVDTGGMDVEPNFVGQEIFRQANQAILQADLVLFVVDGRTGVTPDDKLLAKKIQALNPRVWLVCNKIDTPAMLGQAHETQWFQLGLGQPRAISGATSLGIGDLLDEIVVELQRQGHPLQAIPESQPLRLVLIGRPNVGKSSLTNAILGEERAIVSPIPHTTREPQDTVFTYRNQEIILVDTAGMRKRANITKGLEEAGIERNRQAIQRADIAFMVFDATDDPTIQDRHLAGLLAEEKKGLILVANKWDLVEEKHSQTAAEYERSIRQAFPFLPWAPMIFVSAKEKQRLTKLLDLALEIQAERQRVIDYNAINRVLKSCIKAMRPLAEYGPKSPRIYDAAQVGVTPPRFVITVVGDKVNLHPNWIKFFQKKVREKFGFTGTPIMVQGNHIPVAKSQRKRNIHGPGMEAVAGSVKEKPRRVNQTRRRQKWR